MAREITAGTRTIPRVEERQVKIVSLKRIIWERYIRHRMAVAGTFGRRPASVPVPTFVPHCSTYLYERRNQRDTSNPI